MPMADFAENALRAVCRLSFGRVLFAEASAKSLSRALWVAGAGSVDAQEYLSGSLFLSACALAASFFALLFFWPAHVALGASLVVSGSAFAALAFLPRALARKRTEVAESELPFILRELAIYIEIGLPFEKSIRKVSERKYALAPEFLRAWKSLKSGATMQSELAAISSKFD